MWLSSSREIWSQTRCAILPISSLLATLVTIPVLLNRLLVKKSVVNKTGIVPSIAKSDEIGKIAHLVWRKVSRDFVKQTKSLVNKTGIVTSVAKSDEIGKIVAIFPISSLLATLVTIPVL